MKLLELLLRRESQETKSAREIYWQAAAAAAANPGAKPSSKSVDQLATALEQLRRSPQDFRADVDRLVQLRSAELAAAELETARQALAAAKREQRELEEERKRQFEAHAARSRAIEAKIGAAKGRHWTAKEARSLADRLRLELGRQLAPESVDRGAELTKRLAELEANIRKREREVAEVDDRVRRAKAWIDQVAKRSGSSKAELERNREILVQEETHAASVRSGLEAAQRDLAELRAELEQTEQDLAAAVRVALGGATG